MTRPSQKPGAHAGFTLLELILSMAVAVMLAGTLYAALSTAMKARQSAMQTIATTRVGAMAMDIICHDLENVLPPSNSQSENLFLSGPFQGEHQGSGDSENDDVVFRTMGQDETASDADPLSEAARQVEYLIRTDLNPPVLVRRLTKNVLATVQPTPDDEIIARNVRAFSVQYFDGTEWQTDWDSTQLGDVLPFAVQVTMTLNDPQGAVLSSGQPRTWKLTRVVPLACAKISPETTGITP